MVRSHSCTVGSFRFGSNKVSAGALEDSCKGGVSCATGCVVGAVSGLGKPWPMRMSGAVAQPGVVAPPTVDEQLNTRPGTLPATAVTWNDDSGSKAMPQPARITVLLLFPGFQASPSRGANASTLLFLNQRSACTKLTGCEPVIGASGT